MFADSMSDFLSEIDDAIVQKKETLTCHEIYETQERFKEVIGAFSSSKANFTGFTEMLIYRFLHHHRELIPSSLHAGKPYDGKRMMATNPMKIKTQQPDITMEQNEQIHYLISIKSNHDSSKADADDVISDTVLSLWEGTVKEKESIPVSLQVINRIKNLYGKQGNFRALTIYYKTPSEKNKKMLEMICSIYPWYDFLVLKDNNVSFYEELKNKLYRK